MRSLCALVVALLLAGCATAGDGNPQDPWEGLNRKTFAMNDALDRAVLKPAAHAYQDATPAFAQEGVSDFFSNLDDVGTSLNNFLQGKPREGASDFGRFVVNTVFGVFGLWDVASPLGLEKHNEDFGQTLGVWGMPPGPYFVIPLLGPSTARDAPARAVDPSWYYYSAVNSNAASWGLWGLNVVQTRASLFKAESVLEQAAIDRYSFLRGTWLQRRRNQVYDGNPPRVKEEE